MSIKDPPGDYDEDGYPVYTDSLHGNTGSLSYVSSDKRGIDAVHKLRETVAEITKGRIPVPPRRKLGFY
jgi:hypothetical protein